MPYDEKFYRQYNVHLKEVFTPHKKLFERFAPILHQGRVIEFGCGEGNEFTALSAVCGVSLTKHLRIDLNAIGEHIIHIDYRAELDKIIDIINKAECNIFVSLFSSEIIDDFKKNYEFYKRLFTECSTLQHGLVTGFYYASKLGENPVMEAGDVESYQTLEELNTVKNDLFSEVRLEAFVPSKMFGLDAFEIWKWFTRKPG